MKTGYDDFFKKVKVNRGLTKPSSEDRKPAEILREQVARRQKIRRTKKRFPFRLMLDIRLAGVKSR